MDQHTTQPATRAADDWSAVASAWETGADDVERLKSAPTVALVECLRLTDGQRILELAAGTGTLGTTWSELVGPTGSVVLSDIAPGMVAAAARRCAALANVDVQLLDMANLDLPARSVDAIASRMGLMFVTDPTGALAGMRRVLRHGGRLGALTWAGPEHNPWMTCVGMAAMFNGVVAGGPPIGPGGIFSLGDAGQLADVARDAGFDDITVTALDVAFEAPSIDAHIARVSSLAGPLAAAFATATPEQLAAVRRTATDLAAPNATETGLAIPGCALLLAASA